MNTNFRFKFTILAVIMLGASMVTSTIRAQGPIDDPGSGNGAPIVEPNFGGDITTLNPILVADGPSGTVVNRLFPLFVGVDPDTGLPKPGAPGALATKWSASADGLTYTFTLRTDRKWSDGTPITSADIQYAYDAITSGKVDTTLKAPLVNVASLTTPDPQTVVITYKEADCAAVTTAANIPVVPSATYKKVYPTFADMTKSSKYNLAPTTTAGDFAFSNFRPGEQVTLTADQSFPDALAGHVIPKGYILKQVADQTVGVEQFLAGSITLIPSVPEAREDEMKNLGKQGKLQYFEAPATTRHLLYFNLADPNNPRDGLDKDGKPIDQGHHPIFGDVRVRQAVALSIDYDALNKGAFNGHGVAIGSPVVPQSWAHNDGIKPWPFDPEQAKKLLDEAGFIVDPKNPDGPRIANDKTLYAKPGTPLEFKLTAFSGNPSIDASTVLVQDQLKKVGFKVDLDVIEFQSMVKKLLGQNFDALMVFLGMNPNDPNSIFAQLDASGDKVNSGLNAGSYYNPKFTDLMKQARGLPGCNQAARKKLYDQVQQIIHDDLPVYFVNWSMVPVVAQPDLKNYAPKQFGIRWNISVWSAVAH